MAGDWDWDWNWDSCGIKSNVYDWDLRLRHTHVWSWGISIVSLGVRLRLSGALVPGPLFYPGLTLGWRILNVRNSQGLSQYFDAQVLNLKRRWGEPLKPNVSATVSVDTVTEGGSESNVNPKPVLDACLTKLKKEAPQSTLIEVSINFNSRGSIL